ncbi:MAG: hypothetical protein ACKO6B_00100 [Planctomycetia bacterium]
MISSAPMTAANDLPVLADKIRAFIATAKEKAAGGITVAEFGELTVALLRVVISAADSLPDDGEQKKAWVLAAVGMLFDAVADKCVPLVAWPVWILVRGSVRSLVLMAASGAIESLLPLIRRTLA